MGSRQASNTNQGSENHFFQASAASFKKIPGSPISYWVSTTFVDTFSNSVLMMDYTPPKKGVDTGNNDKFLRYWFEPNHSNVSFPYSLEDVDETKRWRRYNKGGGFRKWYGNNEYLIDWADNGAAVRAYSRSTIRNEKYFGSYSLSWSDVTSYRFSARLSGEGALHDNSGPSAFGEKNKIKSSLAFLCSKLSNHYLASLNPTLHYQIGNVASLPIERNLPHNIVSIADSAVSLTKNDWDFYETSWDFTGLPLLNPDCRQPTIKATYQQLCAYWRKMILEMQRLEEENNLLFIEAYGLQGELTPKVPLKEITLTCNPHYRYGGNRSQEELETLLQCDTIKELMSYAIGCMFGRYSLGKAGLILANQGETLADYLQQVPQPSFPADDDAILPLTEQEWFPDDTTNRFRDFVRTVWGEELLQENLDFVAESLCLHAIKPKKGEAALETIRRYLSTQFYKDHLRTYKKRPIYWLFSSGKQKAFECLVYLHRYNESTLAEMRTDYVIPLTEKLASYVETLEQNKEASASAAEAKSIEQKLSKLYKQQAELNAFDEKLRHYADQRISLDLDDGVKMNYVKFGDLLAEVKAITGSAV